MHDATASLVLRLAGPLQSWGLTSEHNMRGTADRPTRSGVVGLLAAAQGRRRGADITDLVGLEFGVRVDQPGSVLHDYHTVTSLDGSALLSAKVNAKGRQVPTGPKKYTHLTRRSYLQDAVFVVVLSGPTELLAALGAAVRAPRFGLSLGRRSCVPSEPVLLPGPDGRDDWLWNGHVVDVLHRVPWQASAHMRDRDRSGATVSLPATVDRALDTEGAGVPDALSDVPVNFDHRLRGFRTREVSHLWVGVPTGDDLTSSRVAPHDPFSLLGW